MRYAPDEEHSFTSCSRDACLHALSVGYARSNPLSDSELRFVYERHTRFCAVPTLATTWPFAGGDSVLLLALSRAGIMFDAAKLLHGEHELVVSQIVAQSPRRLMNRFRVSSVQKKPGGLLVSVSADTLVQSSLAHIATNVFTLYLCGAKLDGATDEASPSLKASPPPPRPPDAVWSERIDPAAALLFRLSGDTNPLHVDPAFAARAGFEKPILHGLCTLGHSVRAVLLQLCDGDAERVVGIRARFAAPVFTGAVLETAMWRESPEVVLFQASADGAPALLGGRLELRQETPPPAQPSRL
jgi:3-hydroxyacyl-CoA dehydrogenase/3a,7a,12a-trihydroxy-5b-cholest-24-enoyl-CoA hydratase